MEFKGNVLIKAIPLNYYGKGTILEQEKAAEVDLDSFLLMLKNIISFN